MNSHYHGKGISEHVLTKAREESLKGENEVEVGVDVSTLPLGLFALVVRHFVPLLPFVT